MTNQANTNEEFFLGIMVLKDSKWAPVAKFGDGAFGGALERAEELDKEPGYDGVKILRLPKTGKGEQKEMWVSDKAKIRAQAAQANQVAAGAKKSKEQLAAAARQAYAKK